MKRIFFSLILLAIAMYSICAYSKTIAEELHNSVIRLHILAESDSEYDQKIKLNVRDAVLEATKNTDIGNTEAFLAKAEQCANNYLKAHNIPYRATAEFGEFSFPEKTYRNITLPAGRYKGVRILLGSGKGQNWWCVMYPPLCVDGKAEKAEETLQQSLSPQTYEIIAKKPQLRLKVVEIINKYL